MGYAYLFALIVGLGILSIQSVLGSKDADADHDHDLDADGDADFEADADADVDADADADADHEMGANAHTDHETGWDAGFVALFLSVRFWVFASLGFGMSGSLLTFFTGVGVVPTAITAIVMGLVCGLGAATAFRALKRSSGHVAEHTSESAVGMIARVIVPLPEKGIGKVRIELGGRTVDLMAQTTGLRIERGDHVVIEEVDGEMARVGRAPDELK